MERKSPFRGRSSCRLRNLTERAVINRDDLRNLHPMSRFIYKTPGMRGEDLPLGAEPREVSKCLRQVYAFLYLSRRDIGKTLETFEESANTYCGKV